jgi:H/ACA ribonucleoprotein complex subunit 4
MKININKIKKQKSINELLEFGIINIDKPSGPTSFNVSDFVRKNLGLKKTSHFGTLDPKVTGVLPVALSRACKLTGYFLCKDKEYIGVMRIHSDVSLDVLEKAINEKFIGCILQTPPIKSRVKRQERQREIKSFKILERDGKNILFSVCCQAGTYIRKLVSDLGDYLGIGAHMLELRRIRAGIFKEDDLDFPCINLYDFKKAVLKYKKGDEELLRDMIIPAEIISSVYPFLKIKEDNLIKIFTGKPIHKSDVLSEDKFNEGDVVCVFCENRFVGMYKIIKSEYVFAKAEFVLQPIKTH